MNLVKYQEPFQEISMEGIQVSVETVGLNQNIALIKIGGHIDTTTSAEFEHCLNAVLKSNCYRIIIDLGNVDYVSSAGWGIFISEIKGIREKGGDLKLVRMTPDVYEIFELLEFHTILKAFNSLEEAMSAFNETSYTAMPLQPSVEGHQQSQKDVDVVSQTETKIFNTEQKTIVPQETTSNTIEEKIRQVVLENPEIGTIQIMKTLNSSRFGNIKLGWFGIRKYLKKLNLDSKKKRIKYFKQTNFGKK